MITKGGLETVTRHLAMEYAGNGIRVNAVAPGVVDTPLQKANSKDTLKKRSPMGRISTVNDITDASTVTGNTIYVDGGAHFGCW